MSQFSGAGPLSRGGMISRGGVLSKGGLLTLGTGEVPPPGYDWVTLNGERVVFTGTVNGVSYVGAFVYARIS